MPTLTIAFDSASLARARRMSQWNPVLSSHLMPALFKSLDVLEVTAKSYMHAKFKNPTGELEGNFSQGDFSSSAGSVRGRLINDKAYAWRREEGFSGKTDSLGRYYPRDPGIKYMATSITVGKTQVKEIFRAEVQAALDELGA